MRQCLALACALALSLAYASAQVKPAIKYTVELSDPARHLVHVTMEIPPGRDIHDLQMPVWNALYQVRDFAQYIDWIHAKDSNGQELRLSDINASRWRVIAAQNGATIEYQIFADNPDPYGAQLNQHHAFFNLAEILMYADDQRSSSAEVRFVNLPPQWKIAMTLEQTDGWFQAANYDALVDSPVEIGTFLEDHFTAACGRYRVILDAEAELPNQKQPSALLQEIRSPLQRIVSTASAWMNDCPFHDYMFIYHLSNSPSGGGMEHAYSTAVSRAARNFTVDTDFFDRITAHEFFHLWNVKRIRPQSLEPIDYTKENYTPSLWFSEGVDSTVGEYILLRAGLETEQQYLDHLSQQISDFENRPAHLTQSVEESSLAAWLEKYPYYGLPDRSISYYQKGELLGVLLDLAMRGATNDRASLRDLFRWMNEHYAKQGKFFVDSPAVREAAETVSRADLRVFFEKYVSGVNEIPWDLFFAPVGLRISKSEVTFADPGFKIVQQFDQPPTVADVAAGSKAARAGLKQGDVVLQLNGKPAGRTLQREMDNLPPGVVIKILIARDGLKRELQWRLDSRQESIYELRDVHEISAEQKGRRAAWLFDRTP